MIKSEENISNQSQENGKVLLQVRGLHKKFCKNLRYKMFYGLKDLSGYFLGIKPNYENLRKKEFWALDDVNFDIYENQITALVGVNGSGKTTLIRMLAGIYDTERGDIIYSDEVKRVISIFAIKSGLHPTLTGRENILLKGAYYGLNKEEVEKNMDFIVSFSNLGNHMDTPLGNYSSGMKTRLSMSIALSIKGDILYIDEGFSFSDPGFKMKCFEFIRKEYTSGGKAMVIATHQIGKINNLANRIILLDSGKILDSTFDIDEGVSRYLELAEQQGNTL